MLSLIMVRKTKSSKSKKNYFQQFYDGNLSLPHSYWIFGVAYSIAFGLIIAVIVLALGMPERTISVLSLPWIIFISIGIWKSSDKYKGPKFWSVLAKIAIVLSIIQTVGGILTGV